SEFAADSAVRTSTGIHTAMFTLLSPYRFGDVATGACAVRAVPQVRNDRQRQLVPRRGHAAAAQPHRPGKLAWHVGPRLFRLSWPSLLAADIAAAPADACAPLEVSVTPELQLHADSDASLSPMIPASTSSMLTSFSGFSDSPNRMLPAI